MFRGTGTDTFSATCKFACKWHARVSRVKGASILVEYYFEEFFPLTVSVMSSPLVF